MRNSLRRSRHVSASSSYASPGRRKRPTSSSSISSPSRDTNAGRDSIASDGQQPIASPGSVREHNLLGISGEGTEDDNDRIREAPRFCSENSSGSLRRTDSVSTTDSQQLGRGKRASLRATSRILSSDEQGQGLNHGVPLETYSSARSSTDLTHGRSASRLSSTSISSSSRPVPVPRTTSLRNVRRTDREGKERAATTGDRPTSSASIESARSPEQQLDSHASASMSADAQLVRASRSSKPRASAASRATWRNSSASTAAGAAGAGALAAIRSNFGEESSIQPITPAQLQELRRQQQTSSVGHETGGESSGTTASLSSDQPGPLSRPQSMFSDSSSVVHDTWQAMNASGEEGLASRKEPSRPRKSPLRAAGVPHEGSHPSLRSAAADRIVSAPPSASSPEKPEPPPKDRFFARVSPLPPKTDEETIGSDQQTYTPPIAQADLASTSSRPFLGKSFGSSDTIARTDRSQGSHLMETPRNASTPSFVTDDDAERQSSSLVATAPKTQSRRSKTLRKITPPALIIPFARKERGPILATAQEEDAEGKEVLADESTSSAFTVASRRVGGKGWSFRSSSHKDEREREQGKVAKSVRRHREAPIATRPTIRRIFDDEALSEGGGQGGSDADPGNVQPLHGLEPSPLSQQSGQSQLKSTWSDPAINPTDDLPPLLKNFARRYNALLELIETERSYASDLAVTCAVYLVRAKELIGMSSISPLPTPLSSNSTPALSPALSGVKSAPASVLAYPHRTAQGPKSLAHKASREGYNFVAVSGSSGDPSNRSSVYTTSSQTSQGSDLSSAWPPTSSSLPGTPPINQQLQSGSQAKFMPYARNSPTVMGPASPVTSTSSQQRGGPGQKPRINLSAGQNAGSASSTQTSFPGDTPLNTADIRIIFAHLEDTATLADDMATVLHKAMGTLGSGRKRSPVAPNDPPVANDDTLGNALLGFMPRIQSVYTAYCSRHETSMQRMQEIAATSPKAAAFFRECTTVARKHTTAWDLGSLLIKPVQRVLKYPLLLRQIISATDESHPDRPNLVAALDQLQVVADNINEVKRRRDLAGVLITGRAAKESKNPLLSGTLKTKRKVSNKALVASNEETLLSNDPGDKALEDYAALASQFNALQQRVQSFGRRCRAWSMALFNSYNAQLRLLSRLRRVYALRVAEESEAELDPVQNDFRALESMSKEEKTIITYQCMIQAIIDRSWRQLDAEICNAILPMTQKVEYMFAAPRLVMVKRAERETDYLRYRQNVDSTDGPSAKSLERKVLENASGFIALQGQLLDEIPLFMQGAQVLLDVGVQAFARLQAGHMEEVRNVTLQFWVNEGEHSQEVDMMGMDGDDELDIGPTLRHIHPVRTFWEDHRPYLEALQSLTLANSREIDQSIPTEDSDVFHTPNLEAVSTDDRNGGSFAPHQMSESRSSSATNLASATFANSNASSISMLPPAGGSRRPSAVVGLMRSLSGTFGGREPSPRSESAGGNAPPMPAQAAANIRWHTDRDNGDAAEIRDDVAVASMPPSLPSLVFREEERGGFFIQNLPIPFLDSQEQLVQKEPYGVSPSFAMAHLPDIADNPTQSGPSEPFVPLQKSTSGQALSSSDASQISDEGRGDRGSTDTRRHVIRKYPIAVAKEDAPSWVPSPNQQQQQGVDEEESKHQGWPFVHYEQGDSVRVVSSDATSQPGRTLLFGRNDRTGELGWVEERAFTMRA